MSASVYMSAFIYTHVCIRLYMSLHSSIHISLSVHISAFIYTCLHSYTSQHSPLFRVHYNQTARETVGHFHILHVRRRHRLNLSGKYVSLFLKKKQPRNWSSTSASVTAAASIARPACSAVTVRDCHRPSVKVMRLYINIFIYVYVCIYARFI